MVSHIRAPSKVSILGTLPTRTPWVGLITKPPLVFPAVAIAVAIAITISMQGRANGRAERPDEHFSCIFSVVPLTEFLKVNASIGIFIKIVEVSL